MSTGTYSLGTGEATFTADDLASAVLAANDPTVPLPRIKIGHVDQRFESDPSLDGEPAMGTVRNLALSDDGQTIVGDLCDVPAWLADSMQSAYPGRSIEGGFGFKATSGHEYGFVISDLALLGTTWPGVGSLDDLRDVLSKNGTVPDPSKVEAASERFVMAKVASPVSTPDVTAALDVGGIPRVFAADLTAGKVPGEGDKSKWWARSVEASDDGSLSILVDAADRLLRLPITVAGKSLTYGEPTPVAASAGPLNQLKGPRVLASWPSNPTPAQEAKRMKINAEVDQAKLAVKLGLPEDADEAAINKALEGDEAPAGSTATTSSTTATDGGASSTTTLPEGVTMIDEGALAELQAGAAAGTRVAASLDQRERDETILGAIKGGRIVAKQREAWEKRWAVNKDETRTLLTADENDGGLPAVIPVEMVEAGHAGTGEGNTAEVPRLFPELNTSQEAA